MIKSTVFVADMCSIWVVVKGQLSLRQSLGGFKWLATILHEKGNELSEVNHLLSFDIKHIVPLKDLNKIISNYLKFWQLYEK